MNYLIPLVLVVAATFAQAEVVGTLLNLDKTLLVELHDEQGDCAEGLARLQILRSDTREPVAQGCWVKVDERVGIILNGEAAVSVLPSKLFKWART